MFARSFAIRSVSVSRGDMNLVLTYAMASVFGDTARPSAFYFV